MIASTPEQIEAMSPDELATYLKTIDTYFAQQRALIQRMHDTFNNPHLDLLLANIDTATQELKEAADVLLDIDNK